MSVVVVKRKGCLFAAMAMGMAFLKPSLVMRVCSSTSKARVTMGYRWEARVTKVSVKLLPWLPRWYWCIPLVALVATTI
jgi:hypothetical protein